MICRFCLDISTTQYRNSPFQPSVWIFHEHELRLRPPWSSMSNTFPCCVQRPNALSISIDLQMPFPIDDFRNVEHFVSFLQTWTGVFGGQAGFYDCIATDTAESSEYSPPADSLDRLYSNQKAARIFVYLECACMQIELIWFFLYTNFHISFVADDIKDSENPIEVDAILPCNASNRNVKVRVYPNKKVLKKVQKHPQLVIFYFPRSAIEPTIPIWWRILLPNDRLEPVRAICMHIVQQQQHRQFDVFHHRFS